MQRRAVLALGLTVVTAASMLAVTGPVPAAAAQARSKAEWSAYVRAENAKPGTPGWKITGSRAAGTSLAGYADHVSALPGQRVELYVHAEGRIRATAYRLGWYGGVGARKVWSGAFTAHRQPHARTLEGPISDAGGLRDAHVDVAPWTRSVTLNTTGWPEGAYLIRLDGATRSRYVPLTIRSADSAGRLVLVSGILTNEAYDAWGGHSLYKGPDGKADTKALAVSFDRPYDRELGAGESLRYDYGVLQNAERAGLPLAWATDYDVATIPGLLDGAGGIAFGGHSEYWPLSLHDAVRNAEAAGANLAVFGANTSYWRARLAGRELDLHHHDGRPRVLVVTRNAATDPLSATDPAGTTVRYRDQPLPQPEEGMLGGRFLCTPGRADWVVTDPDWFGYAGTGVTAGSRITAAVGQEFDVAAPPDEGPQGIQVVAYTKLTCQSQQTAHTGVYFTTPSGAGVFDAGSIEWPCTTVNSCAGRTIPAADAALAGQITRNILTEFSVAGAGLRRPAVDNLSQYWVPTVTMARGVA
jgi:hypothetical protein